MNSTRVLAALALAALTPARALAIDGMSLTGMSGGGEVESLSGMSQSGGGESYYQSVVGADSVATLESSSAGQPQSLWIDDSAATLDYVSVAGPNGGLEWLARIRGFTRPLEQVDALYHVIAILPLPVDAQGRVSARALNGGVQPREGTPEASVPLIYGGEKVVLKRSQALERTLLPSLIGDGPGQLPSLAGTGYGYTFWDTILRYDASGGDTLQLFADLRYTTDGSVVAPDAQDERLKAYVVTWIPALDPSIPPYAVRFDVVPLP